MRRWRVRRHHLSAPGSRHNKSWLELDRVIHVDEGKDTKIIEDIIGYLCTKQVQPEQIIAQANIDLSPAFISSIKKNFPQAEITFNRFHVAKLLNE